MKNIIIKIILFGNFLLGQTVDQIKQAKEMLSKTGMSKGQAIDAAKARGYSKNQIEDAIKRSESLNTDPVRPDVIFDEKIDQKNIGKSNEIEQGSVSKETSSADTENLIANDVEDNLEIIDESELDIESQEQLLGKNNLPYFGYDIFKSDPALFQASTIGAVDPDYLIGPGDEIIVMLWGETQFRQVFTVDREGFVFIPEIGQVFVNGLNLNLLESKLFRVFSQSYASLNPQGRSPTTFLDVSLGNLRPLRIQVLGEVIQPGAYTVSPSATLFSSLYYFNGPSTFGSLRDVQLIRGSKKIASIDFYEYLLTGKKPNDQKLQLDDVVFIPRRLKTVTIDGEINRGGIYELKPEESLLDLIEIAGDLKVTAYLGRSQVDRIVPFEDRMEKGMDRMYIDVSLEKILETGEKFELQDGDYIQIFSVLGLRQNIVDVRGSVTRPGRYDLGDSLKISELLTKADGLLGDAYMNRVDVVRINEDFSEKLIKLDLSKVIRGDFENDISLKGLDRVKVYSMTEMVPKRFVSINGHVLRPGRYLLQENMTLYDLIFKGGGFVDEEFKKRTYLKRAELIRSEENNENKKVIPFHLGDVLDRKGIFDSLLRSNDAIRIYSLAEIEGDTRYVSISGHVKRPGFYELYEQNMTLYDILFKTGGFEDPLFKSKTFLKRADLIRFESDQIGRIIIPFSLDSIMSNKDSKDNIILMPGDEIRVYPENIFNSIKNVTIDGVVRNPGIYELKSNMNLKDLILESGGTGSNVYRYRVEVARIDPLNKNLDDYAKVIIFNIDEKFSISSPTSQDELNSADFKLEPYDLVTVRPDPYFNNQRQVTISGRVLYPGNYTILSSEEKITDIIDRSGGLVQGAYLQASQFIRDGQEINIPFKEILKRKKSIFNLRVQSGDQIKILSKPYLITVSGEVNKDGISKFVPKKRLRYYLKASGGLGPNADEDNIWIEYPNGESKKYNKWQIFSPKVLDGSVIFVGKRPDEEPIDKTEFAKELTSIIANLAQVLAIVSLANP